MNDDLKISINQFLRRMDMFNTLAFTGTYKQYERFGVIDKINSSNTNRNFLNFLNKKVFKNSFTRYRKQLNVVPVFEMGKENRLHTHMVIEIPNSKYVSNKDFYNLLKECWNKTYYGDQQTKIVTQIDVGWINYITKFRTYGDDVDWENVTLEY